MDENFEFEKESNSESDATHTSEINQSDESNNTFDTDDDELSETFEIKRSIICRNFKTFLLISYENIKKKAECITD